METHLQQLLTELSVLQPIQENLSKYEKILNEISEFHDPSVIIPLLDLLDDCAISDDAMFEIIHYIESFDDNDYVKNVLKSIDKTFQTAPHWACLLITRIFNNPSCVVVFDKLVSQNGINTSFFKKLYEAIISDYPSLENKAKIHLLVH